jgi:P27 family predicted phage terminase small subunit
MPSPKPRPPKLRLLNGRHAGVDSGGRKVADGPAFRRIAPEKPRDLTPDASAHWDLIVDELLRLDLTKPLDAGSLALACETFSRWKQAQRIVNALSEAELYVDGRRHSAFVTIETASREYRAWAAEFGLTPSAEGRLGTKEAKGASANPFAGPTAVG